MEKLKTFSSTVLRIGIALVFLWFGWSQIHNGAEWVGYVPSWASTLSHLSVSTIVYLNGIFEILFGTALLLGFFTRWVAFLLAFHMFDITLVVGLDATGVRDFGLSVAALCVWLNGADMWTWDNYIVKSEVIKTS